MSGYDMHNGDDRRGSFAPYFVAGGVVALYIITQYTEMRKREVNQSSHYWTIWMAHFVSWSYKILLKSREMLQEGYNKYNGSVFKVPRFQRWHVIISGEELVEQIRKAPEDVLSFTEAARETLAIPWTMGSQVLKGNYQTPLIRNQFTRSLGVLFDEIRDEIESSFGDVLQLNGNEWTAVPADKTIVEVIARTSSRAFVGYPLCREPEYLKLAIKFTVDVMTGAALLNVVPFILRPVFGKLLTCARTKKKAAKFFKPIIEERLEKISTHELDYPDKPVDMLAWLIDRAEGEERTVEALCARLMSINVAAIHSSSMVFTHALYHLAAEPDKYIPELREEVENVVQEYGWSKDSLWRMCKVDSFLKETLRYRGVDLVSLTRKVLQPFTLADGTFLPVGTFVSAASGAMHFDTAHYSEPSVFDGFRYVKAENRGEEDMKEQMATTGWDYLAFGHGRHACPGRFFLAVELKVMLAHVLLHYDVRTVDAGIRPPDQYLGTAVVPNTRASVLFKRRQEWKSCQ